jgi:UDP-N-acetyl-D-mannosaminuronic acid dehydrogenase
MIRNGVKDLRAELRTRIDRMEVTIGVVGLGFVGLPVAASFASRGCRVVGVDVDEGRVRTVAAGANPLDEDEPGLSDLIRSATSRGALAVTADPSALSDADVILIAVETPVGDDHLADYGALRAACRSVARMLRPGRLVVVESTVAPGVTGGIVRRELESGSGLTCETDFYLGHCPERLMPGKLLRNIRTLHRVCGGSSPATADLVVALYRHIVSADLDPVDLVTAELVKTAENAYYDLNIAFANEVALICEEVGADVSQVRALVNKSPGRNMLVAGAGVGGACIPKDPWLLAAVPGRVRAPLIAEARRVNDGMPGHVVELTRSGLARHGKDLPGALIAVLGVAYREDTKDDRNSPTSVLVRALREGGATVRLHDPHVPGHQGPLAAVTDRADAVLVMVAHSAYRGIDPVSLRRAMRTPVLVDGRRVFDPAAAEAAGFTYLAVGRGARWS